MNNYLFTKLFYLFLFLVICGTLCVHVCAGSEPSTAKNPVKVFEKEEQLTSVLKPTDHTQQEGVEDVKVKEFHSPVVVSSGDVLVALAAIKGNDKINNNITVLTKHIGIEGNAGWAETLFTTPGSGGWTTQFAVYGNRILAGGDSVVRGLVAAASNNKIYLLLVNASATSSAVSAPASVSPIEFRLAVGTVGGGKIKWVIKEPLPSSADPKFTQLIEGKQLSESAFSGSPLVTKDKVIFLLRIVTNDDKKTVFAFVDLKDTGDPEKVQFSPFGEVAQNCYPYFFIWESKIILIPTQCTEDSSNQKIKEITDITATENNWIVSSGPFNILVEFFKDKSDLTAANINDSEVLLFTQKKKKEKQPGNNDVYLWVTDGNHSYRAKDFLTDVSDAPISLFYKDNELLVLYQKWEQSEPKEIFLKRLKTQLDDITFVIEAWKNTDETVKQLCGKKILCDTELPTNGLVGFLSNNSEGTKTWKDEYYYVNATLKLNSNIKPEKVTDGFMFNGEGVGAQWQVDKDQKEDQPYKFTDSGFTLVATVQINQHVETVGNSLLGVKLSGKTKHVGLWCSKNKKWAVSTGDESSLKESDAICKLERQYSVAFVLRKPKIFVYVNWEELTFLNKEEIKIETEEIEKFYFGADTDVQKPQTAIPETHVTVTNVLLYNRPFEINEIESLKQKVKPVEDIELSDQNGDKNTTDDSDQSSSTPMLPSTDEEEDEENERPSRTEDGGVGGGVRVFSLLLAVLCVSAPLLHL